MESQSPSSSVVLTSGVVLTSDQSSMFNEPNASEETITASYGMSNGGIQTKDIIFITFELVLFVVICFGNSLVIASVASFRELQTITNAFVVSLAVADSLVGLSMPFHVVFFLYDELGSHFVPCMARFVTIMFPAAASVFLMVGIAVERYVAINHPFKYVSFVAPKRVAAAIFFVWTYAFLLGALSPFIGWNQWVPGVKCDVFLVLHPSYTRVFVIGHTVTMLVIISLLYWRIFVTARIHQRKIASTTITVEDRTNINNILANTKAARNLLVVIGAFAFCYLPGCTVMTIQSYTGRATGILAFLRTLFTILTIMNSAVNPFIYGLRMRRFRVAYSRLLRLKIRVADNSSTVT